jgi:predicted PurR-regulated permease PerM
MKNYINDDTLREESEKGDSNARHLDYINHSLQYNNAQNTAINENLRDINERLEEANTQRIKVDANLEILNKTLEVNAKYIKNATTVMLPIIVGLLLTMVLVLLDFF